jgi:flagellar motility protein MotE (MotC chaperone)
LQERIQDLKVQLAALVDSFEQQCGTFCSAFSRPQLEQQQAELQRQEQQAEACLRAAQQQLQAKCKQLTKQKAAVKQLQQQVADSRASMKGGSVARATERRMLCHWH